MGWKVFNGDDVTDGVYPANAVSGQDTKREELPVGERRNMIRQEEILETVTGKPENRTGDEN